MPRIAERFQRLRLDLRGQHHPSPAGIRVPQRAPRGLDDVRTHHRLAAAGGNAQAGVGHGGQAGHRQYASGKPSSTQAANASTALPGRAAEAFEAFECASLGTARGEGHVSLLLWGGFQPRQFSRSIAARGPLPQAACTKAAGSGMAFHVSVPGCRRASAGTRCPGSRSCSADRSPRLRRRSPSGPSNFGSRRSARLVGTLPLVLRSSPRDAVEQQVVARCRRVRRGRRRFFARVERGVPVPRTRRARRELIRT